MSSMDTPIFLGTALPARERKAGDRVWTFDFPGQVDAYVAHLAGETGCELAITIVDKASEKTRLQEAGFHAMIRPLQIALGWNIDQVKQWLLAQIFGTWEWVDTASGMRFELLNEPRTSSLTKVQYSELIERSMEIAASLPRPIILTAPDEYRQLKEKERRKAARAERGKAHQTADATEVDDI
jgi:hypothetical protein